MNRKRAGAWLVIAVITAVVLSLWDQALLWPVKILVVLFHELGHAVATWLTGGEVVEIALGPNESGHALSRGGWRLLILNAGYLGSLVAGVALLAAGRRPRGARFAVHTLAVIMLAAAVTLVRPLWGFGFAYTLVMGLLTLGAARWLPTGAQQLGVRSFGVFSVLYALIDMRADVFGGPGAAGDAALLAASTGVAAGVWGVGWIAAGVLTLWLLRRWWL